MASHIHRHKAVSIGQVRGHLPAPGEPTLRKAVDEENRTTTRVARLDDVELHASAPRDLMALHFILRS